MEHTQDSSAPVGENNNGGAGYDSATEVTFTMPVVTGPFTISGFPGLVARALRNPADNFLDLLFRRTDEPTFGAPPTDPPNWTVLFASQYNRTESKRPKLTVETIIQPD